MFSVGNLTVYEKLSEICLVPVSELCMYPEKPQSVGNLPTPRFKKTLNIASKLKINFVRVLV